MTRLCGHAPVMAEHGRIQNDEIKKMCGHAKRLPSCVPGDEVAGVHYMQCVPCVDTLS